MLRDPSLQLVWLEKGFVGLNNVNFGNPRFLDDERAEMFLGVDAGHTPAHQRADQLFQPPAFKNDYRGGIYQK